MIKRINFLCLLLLVTVSCNTNSIFSEYEAIPDGLWNKNQEVLFTVNTVDTTSKHNAFLNIRNDDSYEFSNLFVIVNMQFPDGNTVIDTLEYEMAKPTGEWLGSGITSVKENKLWYKENIVFPIPGDYKVKIAHAMRKNGVVDGVQELKGITDVGFELEKSQK